MIFSSGIDTENERWTIDYRALTVENIGNLLNAFVGVHWLSRNVVIWGTRVCIAAEWMVHGCHLGEVNGDSRYCISLSASTRFINEPLDNLDTSNSLWVNDLVLLSFSLYNTPSCHPPPPKKNAARGYTTHT